MKARALTVFTVSLFALALVLTAAAPGVPATPTPVPEEHPQIHDAIGALRNAKNHLEHAKHDFGGHRAAAISSINSSLEQLEICLKYDR